MSERVDRSREIAETIARYNQPLLISLSVVTVLAHDLIAGLPKSVTLYLLAGFPIIFCWMWARVTGMKPWRENLFTTGLLLMWAMFMLFVVMMAATRDDRPRATLCRTYLSVMQTTPIQTPKLLTEAAVDRMNAAASAASALKCWP